MIKKITINLIWIISLILLSGCSGEGNNPQTDRPNSQTVSNDSIGKIESISLDSLYEVIDDLVDSTVILTAYVDHVCRHGGMRMNLIAPGDSLSIHAVVPEGGERLNDSLDQREISVEVIVREHRIDRAYLDQWKMQLDSQEDPHLDEYDYIQDLRLELKNNDQEYIPEYWLELEKIIK
jgi:hypothetical protein